jgi:LDH2 family malate/lactate/ureidoglycolate dehydrogenase
LVVDLATSVVARGNIIEAARLHEPIPLDWALDAQGNPTSDASEALMGSLLPMGGFKGYALALVVEVLTGVLSGAGIGPDVLNPYGDRPEPSNVGHFFLALNPAHFLPVAEFYERVRHLENGIREVTPIPGARVALPGDRSERVRQQYQEVGIPIDGPLVDQLNQWADRLTMRPLAVTASP